MTSPTRMWIAMAAALALAAGQAHAALSADDLLLVVNKRQPAGRALAEEYARLRGVPDGRIVEIDVPDLDEIDAVFYERSIADVVRTAIVERHLRERVRCIVLFYGLPLRVRERKQTPAERTEVAEVIEPMYRALHDRVQSATTTIETVAGELSPAFRPAVAPDTAAGFRQRIAAAEQVALPALQSLQDDEKRRDAQMRLGAAQQSLRSVPTIAGMPTTTPTSLPTQTQVDALLRDADDPIARRSLRELVYAAKNSFQLLTLVESQRATLTSTEAEASVDSELSCLFVPNYPRTKWLPNPFHYTGQAAALRSLTIRTCRIDGPTPEVARRIINDSVVVERRGLRGDVVLDARGLAGDGAFGSYDYYDRTIRRTFDLFKADADLPTITDDKEPLIADHASARAAIYCGWYRVRNYAPTATYVPGAIAFHVASYEMIGLRSPAEAGWCRGLLLAGADATLGAVGEPYLLAFPPADEFWSLVLTGQPTLAEAYWATLPVTSWKMILIGDPLYRPFAAKPALRRDQLAGPLGASIDSR